MEAKRSGIAIGLVVLMMGLVVSPAFGVASFTTLQEARNGTDLSLFEDASAYGTMPQDSQPAVTRVRLVTVDRAALQGPAGLPQRLNLNLFADVAYVAALDRVESNPSGSYTWIGRLEGVSRSLVILVVNDDALVGKVSSPEGVYQVSYAGSPGLHRIAQIDAAMLPAEDAPASVDIPAQIQSAPDAIDSASDGSVLDVMVLYTQDASAAAGSSSAMQNEIVLAVAEANTSYANSGIDQRLDLVHMEEVTYTESNSSSTDLNCIRIRGDGCLDNIHSLRNAYHADHVMLVTRYDNPDYCGSGYWMDTVTPYFDAYAFAVATRLCVTSQLTLAHELGHNMWAHHDWYMVSNTAPYSYIHGYSNVADKWRTVMAYGDWCDCSDEVSPCPAYASRVTPSSPFCTRLAYWSNPAVTVEGDPMGIDGGTSTACTPGSLTPDPGSCDADNHRVLNNTASTCDQFRPSQITWKGITSDWNTATNWEIAEGAVGVTTMVNRVPRSIDDVLIPASASSFPAISSGTATAREVIIESGAQLSMSGGMLTVYGTWEEQGTGHLSATGGTVAFVGSLDQTITANPGSAFYDLRIGDGTSTKTVTANSDLDVNGDLDILSGASFAAGWNTVTVAGDWSEYGTGFVPGFSTVVLDGSTQNIRKRSSSLAHLLGPEGFEASFPPTGWTLQDNGNGSWAREDSFLVPNANNTSGSGHCAASADDQARMVSALDNELRSSSIGIPGAASSVWLEYESNFQDWNGNGDAWLDISTNGGSSWTNLTNWTADHGPTSEVVDLSDYVGETVMLRWRYQAPTDYAWFWQIDDVEVYSYLDSWQGAPAFHHLTVDSTGSSTLNGNLIVSGDLTINSGAVLDLGANTAAVEGAVSNVGKVMQTLDTPTSTTTAFLRITDAAGISTKYYGVDILPAGSMGATTVQIKGNQSGCTTYSLDPVLKRCYDIAPTTAQNATVTFWYTEGERNGQDASALKVWHWGGWRWDQVGDGYSYSESGTDCITGGGNACYFRASNLNSYSPFASGSSTVPTGSPGFPTAVTLASFAASPLPGAVRLDWKTAAEFDTLGFVLSRSESLDDPRIQLTSVPIPAQKPGNLTGATYSYVDDSVVRGTTYLYWLAAVDVNGMTTRDEARSQAVHVASQYLIYLPQITE